MTTSTQQEAEIINLESSKVFKILNNLYSNNFQGGIYNINTKSKSSIIKSISTKNNPNPKLFILDRYYFQFKDFEDNEEVIELIQAMLKHVPYFIKVEKIINTDSFVYLVTRDIKTFMFLPIEDKFKYIPKIREIIAQLATSNTQPSFNNYLIEESTKDITFFEMHNVAQLPKEEYIRYLQITFVMQVLCKNEQALNRFALYGQYKQLVNKLDEMFKNINVKYWRYILYPYFIYTRYCDVDLLTLFANPITKNESIIQQLLLKLQQQVVRLF